MRIRSYYIKGFRIMVRGMGLRLSGVTGFLGAMLVLCCWIPTAHAQPEPESKDEDAVRKSVVKIYSVLRPHSLSSPWKRLTSKSVTGSGAVISQDQVLTNFHVVAHATDVSISLDGQSDRVSGEVEAIAPGLDLAVIRLEEPLPDSVVPLELASETPKSGTKIQVLGYPKGGSTLSVTEGVISRIEHVTYKYRTFGLRTQVDAPVNNGNSGGPMVAGSKIVGVAFSGLSTGNDINYAIPCEEIKTALEDIQDGKYDGKPQICFKTQVLASKELRSYLKMPSDATGIRFARMPIPVDDYPLQVDDVITHIGEFNVNNLGKVNFDSNTQVSYYYAVEKSAKDGKVTLKILRDGNAMEVDVPVFTDGHYLMNYMINDPPTYFVYGPIVFGIATADFMASLDSASSRGGSMARSVQTILSTMQQRETPLFMRRFDRVKEPGEQLVIVSKLIKNRMTRDLRVSVPDVIRTINGQKVASIREAAELILSLKDDKLVIQFDNNRGTTIVMDRRQIDREHEQILEDNGIVRSASKDLRDIWTK